MRNVNEEFDEECKTKIEKVNRIKESLNIILAKCKRLVSSFSHSESLVRQLKEKQNEPDFQKKNRVLYVMFVRSSNKQHIKDSIYW